MKFVSVTEVSNIGKGAIALILTVGALLQVPVFGQVATQAAAHHPHIAVLVGAFTTLAALLSNPQVQKILNLTVPAGSTIQQTTTVKTPEV